LILMKIRNARTIIGVVIFLTIILAMVSYVTLTGSLSILQVLLNGILMGGLYGLMAMGLALIFGIMKIINVCHGEFILLGAYVTFWLNYIFSVNPLLTLPISFLILFLIGLPIGKFLMNRSLKFGVDPPLLVAFGISITMQGFMRLLWSATPRGVFMRYETWVLPGGIAVSPMRLMAFVAAVLGLSLLYTFLTKTLPGKALRAVSMDRPTASLMGINPDRINTLAYGLGAALAGVTGSLVAIIFSFDPASGGLYIGRALCVIVLGGVGHVLGTLAGGLFLGVAENMASFFLGDAIREGVAYVIFLLVLLFRPTGLFAKYRAF